MPLNKLENFIKNTEGRILYVNPNDLDSTDGIENQGNSLTKPFKTIQRALIEAARFSYLRGDDNDLVERTTILLYPGEHIVDNRPGFGIRSDGGVARAITPAGASSGASNTLSLTLDSNFDLTQEDNILYKFNSVNGGVVVPRGTSIVGLDLRKTKVRPKYVPNPTDSSTRQSAIFRITGACYFWQFTIFDGNETGTVYTDPTDFSVNNQSKPTFSHHKLTCFEYADGVNTFDQFSGLTDLDIYYSKLTNAFNRASGRDIDNKYPDSPKSFAPQRPEFEIVGAFATDPLNITNIESGDGATPGQEVTVTTSVPHNLTGGTPIKIRGVNVPDYNISTKVSSVISTTQFRYLLPFVRPNLPAGSAGGLSSANAQVLVETDTVTGASPYIFNISLRSVFGMQGMHADGAKATGFKSMVVAQFTAVSLQKDDRAFVKYDPTNRTYSGIQFSKQTGELLSSESSSTNPNTVYHLDQEANYRKEWRTSHIKVSNDAVVQIVSVFAIGFHSHFNMINGSDASITNSNSNFGTFALAAEGFKKEAFAKDDKGFVTSIITPRSIVSTDQKIEYLQVDVSETSPTRVYFTGQTVLTNPTAGIAQGFRIGAKVGEKLYVDKGGTTYQAKIVMSNGTMTATTDTSEKKYTATHSATTDTAKSVFTLVGGHSLQNGESIRVFADNGDLPENLDPHKVYFAITVEGDGTLGTNQIRIASSKTNAELSTPIFIKTVASTSEKFEIVSRVSDKNPNDKGHPIQYDTTKNQWFVHVINEVGTNQIHDGSNIYSGADNNDITYILRRDDDRGIDEKVYKLRYFVPKELVNGRDPIEGFVLQDSSSTNVTANTDFAKPSITVNDYAFDRNTKFISMLSFDTGTNKVTLRSDKPHNLGVGDQIIIKNVKSTTNTTGVEGKGYNGIFLVTDVDNDKEFKYSNTDTSGVVHTVGTFDATDTQTRSTLLPRFERNDNNSNLFIYRTEVITPYIEGVQDGIYHLFVLNGDNSMTDPSNQFDDKFNQNIVNLYPELDRDNFDDNPPEATTFAKRFPIGDVVTNDLKKSITRETTNKFLDTFGTTNTISSVSDNTTTADLTLTEQHGLQSLQKINSIVDGGSGYTNGTYYNVKLFNTGASPASAVWDGATADITVSGGAVTNVIRIASGGSGYTNGEELFFDTSSPGTGGIGGAPEAKVNIVTAGISSATGNYVQVTGLSTGTDAYYRISAATTPNVISVHKSATDIILDGQKVIDLGAWVSVASASQSGDDTTFNTNQAHGLMVGNSFRVLTAADVNAGDFVVKSVVDFNTFTATTKYAAGALLQSNTAPKYILKHGLSANESLSGKTGENIGVRGLSFFDHEILFATEDIIPTDVSFKVALPDGSVDSSQITKRFPIGSYVQIDGEIMRVASNALAGGGDELVVIRGALGTISPAKHPNGSKIKKIKPLPIELRRPSILRASGHTFEYLGYGPGNYSTALPQLQNRTLTEREEFLSQSQETSCGNVVYTGMNDKGDFYIGNTKISSSSGQQTTFDIPVPTITGEDPNRLSIVADEVIVKERLLVEGGTSKQILSQFDGPVTFNGDVRLSNPIKELVSQAKIVGQDARFRDKTEAIGISTASVTFEGGVGIAKSVYIGGDLIGSGSPLPNISGITSVTATSFFGDGAGLTNTGATLSPSGSDGDGGTIDTQRVVLTHLTSGTMTKGTTDADLAFTSSTNTLACTTFSGALSGNATSSSTSADLSFGTANQVVFKNASNNGATSSNLTFDGTSLGAEQIVLANTKKLFFGTTSSGLNISYTDATNQGSKIIHNGTDDLRFQFAGNQMIFEKTSGENFMLLDHTSNEVRLSYAGSSESGGGVKLITQSGGVKITGQLEVTDDIIAFVTSDKTLKENITPITNALDKIKSLTGNTFKWKSDVEYHGGKDDVGVIAQEVEALGLPNLTVDREGGTKAVQYTKLIAILIEAVKELSTKVSALEGS